MNQKISAPVSVSFSYDAKKQRVAPRGIIWNGRLYPIIKIGLHHTFRQGLTLYHVFSVATPTLFLRIVLNTDNLHWKLEEISDGLTS